MAPSSCTLPPTLCCVRNIREVGFGSGQLLLANRRRCGQFLPNPTGFGISGSGFAEPRFSENSAPCCGMAKTAKDAAEFCCCGVSYHSSALSRAHSKPSRPQSETEHTDRRKYVCRHGTETNMLTSLISRSSTLRGSNSQVTPTSHRLLHAPFISL